MSMYLLFNHLPIDFYFIYLALTIASKKIERERADGSYPLYRTLIPIY